MWVTFVKITEHTPNCSSHTKQSYTNLLVLQLLFLEQSLQILHVIVFEVFNEAARCLKTLLDGEASCFIPEHTTKDTTEN